MTLEALFAQLGVYLSATKAGARNSAADKRWLQTAHDAIALAGAECQPAGAEDETKALSLDERVDAVRQAGWQEMERTRTSQQDVVCYPAAVYDAFVVIKIGMQFYTATYTVEPFGIQVQPRQEWQPVEQSWTPTGETKSLWVEPNAPFAVKALGGDRIGGYAVIYGDADHPDLSPQRDFFTKTTEFWLDKFGPKRPIIYHHAQDDATKAAPVVGIWDTALQDDTGLWVEGELDKAHKYRKAVKELVNRGVLALSSDSAPHLVTRRKAAKNTHEITRWPLLAASLTPTPAEPRLLPVETIKSAYKAIGLSFNDLPIGDLAIGDEPSQQADDRARGLRVRHRLLDLEG